MDNLMVKIMDEQGNLVERKILFTFECEELGKNYIAYEGNNSQEVCVVSYDPEVDLNKFEPVTDTEELKMVNDILNEIMEQGE